MIERWQWPAVAGIVLSMMTCGSASAHPLGNFTINHLAVVRPTRGGLAVRYVLDIAEIPSFQIMHADAWTHSRMTSWIDEESLRVSRGLSIRANGVPVQLILRKATATTRPGAGGLPTLYWAGDYGAALPHTATVVIVDRVYADRRIGWKDIVLPGYVDVTDELRAYSNLAIASPRHIDLATFADDRGRITRVAVGGDRATFWSVGSIARTSALSDLFSRDRQTPWLIFLTVLAAFGLGALHGLEPGHGKALMAFTLVGARATVKQAAILAASLTFAHTIAVFLLGLLLFVAAGFATESIFSWVTLLSGAVVAAIGARSLSVAVAGLCRRHRAHDDHHHHHAVSGAAPLQFRGAVIAAMSGGIAPCPAAIVVLLAALHLHRIGYGMFLIVIFSLGLASILTGLGFAVVRGAAWLQRRSAFARIAAVAPLLTGVVISTIGATMVAQALVDRGATPSGVAIVIITFFVLLAFALIPRQRPPEIQAA